jgi:hypothetical protein
MEKSREMKRRGSWFESHVGIQSSHLNANCLSLYHSGTRLITGARKARRFPNQNEMNSGKIQRFKKLLG